MSRRRVFSILVCGLLVGCGGGGGGADNGLVLEGTLIQGNGEHARFVPKHSSGEPIGDVQICALGSCSTTDALGHWGFLVEGGFSGGNVELTVVGHHIETTTVIQIPAQAENVVVELQNNGGTVVAHSITIDGNEQ